MKIKSLLLLGLLTMTGMNAFAADAYVNSNGVRYKYNDEAIASGAKVFGVLTATNAEKLTIVKEITVGDATLKVVGFEPDWYMATGEQDITTGNKELTIDITNFTAPFVDGTFSALTNLESLTLKGTSTINGDYVVPAFTNAKLKTLNYADLAAKSGKKLTLDSYAHNAVVESITVPAAMEGVDFSSSTNAALVVTGVKLVSASAFKNSKVKTVTLAEGATIGDNAFESVDNADFSINMGVATEIGKEAFKSSSIKSIDLAAAKKVGANAFQATTVETVTIPAQVEEIADNAFANINGLKTVNINLNNDKATTIGAWFNESSITALTINAPKVTAIAGSAFAASPIATLTLTDAKKVESIGADAFASYASDELDLSTLESLKTVDATSFKKGAYKKVYLKGTALDNANFVNAQAWLTGCRGTLEEITFPDALTEIGTLNDYTALKAVDLPDGLKTIKENAFERCTALEAIKIKSNVETIGNLAFEGCSKLASVDLVDASALTAIGVSAFEHTALAAVDFAGTTSLATIGAAAFASTKITTVKIPATLKVLAGQVFANNADLESVDFSEAASLEKIETKAFDKATKLLAIDLDGAVKLTNVANDAFPKNKYTSVKANNTALAGRDSDGNYYDNFSEPFSAPFILEMAYNQEDPFTITLPTGLETVKASQFRTWTALKEISLPKAVKTIGAYAFQGSGLTGIKIRENVTEIQNDAFEGCVNLAGINFAEATSLTTIGNSAFANLYNTTEETGLTAVAIPAAVTTIDPWAFAGCKALATVDFSQAAALTTIGEGAFANTAITEIDLTKATELTKVDDNAFPQNKYTKVLLAGTKLYTPEVADPYAAENDYVTVPFSDDNILKGAKESLTEITFPAGYPIDRFDEFSSFTALTSIALPADATEIPNYAFQGSNITSFEVGENITRIGKFAFQNSALESIDFTKATALTEIDDAAFANTASLKSVGLPKNLEVIPASAFEGSALESVKIKSHVKKILTAAFKNCAKLATVNFEDANALEQIKDQAFLGTALTTIDLSGATKLTKVENDAFPKNVYTSVKLNGTALAGRDADGNYYDNFSEPFSAPYIMEKAYNQDGALEMTLPAGLETVNASQFKEWTALKEISLPKAVTLIGANAFQASGLTGIKIRENVTKIDQEAFKGCKDLATVNMSEAAALTEIGMAAFADCYFKDADGNETGLASIAIPAAVTKIGTAAFSGCALLAEADFSQAAALEEIGVNAFNEFGTSKATALTVIDLSACAKLATVYESSFPKNNYTKILLNGTALTDLAPVKVWMSNTAANPDDPTCKTTLKEITLPAQVTTIPSQFLADFTGVTEVSLPRECTTIESYAFAGSGLTGIKIRSKVQTIGSGAFVNCENLATANFAEATALTSIGNIAFKNTAVAEVVIPENADEDPLFIGVAAFKDSKLKSFSAKSWALGTVFDDETGSFVNGKYVSDELFMGTKLNGIAIPAVMEKIGDYAFADCKKLASVKFKHAKKLEVLEEIGDYAFRNCESLEALDLSNTKLEAIESYRPFEGCTALATITFPKELTSLNSDYLFADCPIENLEAPNLEVSGVLFGYYRQFDDEDPTVFLDYEPRDKDNANTTLKTVKIAGYIPEACFLYCTALESVEWLGGELPASTTTRPITPYPGPLAADPTATYNYPVDNFAFAYCTGLQTFTYEPENEIQTLMVSDEAFIGCTPYLLFATNSNYLDFVATWHKGAAPINTTFGDVDITKVTTVQDKANASQFIAKYVNNGPQPVYIDANDAKVYSIYVDGDAAYFSACRTFDGKYVIQPQTTAYGPGFDSHVIVVTEEAKEVPIHRMFLNELYEGIYNKRSVAYDDCYDSQKDDDLALVLHNAMTAGGATTGQYYLYRLTNTSGIGFGFTSFTGTNIKEGQFFVACSKKPEGAGRLTTVWLDEDGNVIRTDGEATGIESVESNGADNDAIFNMQGVRVEKAQKGIYIQNGKKIVVK